MKPDVLLLDEPTNHLYLRTIIWLTHYLTKVLDESATLIAVSHDRALLNTVCSRIIHFRNDKSLAYYKGNNDTFEQVIDDKNAFNAQLAEKIEMKEKKLKDIITKSAQMGHKNNDDNLLQLAAQRKKKLYRVGNEKNEKGHRFKLNRDRAGYHFKDDLRDKAEEQQVEIAAKWDIPTPIFASHRIDLPLISLENVSFSYEKNHPIVSNVNLTLFGKESVLILGRNRCGKSILMQLIGQSKSPTKITVRYEHTKETEFAQVSGICVGCHPTLVPDTQHPYPITEFSRV